MRGYLAWDDAHLEDSLDMEFRYTQVYRAICLPPPQERIGNGFA